MIFIINTKRASMLEENRNYFIIIIPWSEKRYHFYKESYYYNYQSYDQYRFNLIRNFDVYDLSEILTIGPCIGDLDIITHIGLVDKYLSIFYILSLLPFMPYKSLHSIWNIDNHIWGWGITVHHHVIWSIVVHK